MQTDGKTEEMLLLLLSFWRGTTLAERRASAWGFSWERTESVGATFSTCHLSWGYNRADKILHRCFFLFALALLRVVYLG